MPRDCARVTPVEPAASTTAPFRIRRPGDGSDEHSTLYIHPCHVTEGDGGGHLGVAVVGLRGGLGLGLDSSEDLTRHRAVLGVWDKQAVMGGYNMIKISRYIECKRIDCVLFPYH